MKVLSFPNQMPPVSEVKSTISEPFKEYVEQKEIKDAEIKVTLQQIEQKMVDLKALLAQISAIRSDKNVS